MQEKIEYSPRSYRNRLINKQPRPLNLASGKEQENTMKTFITIIVMVVSMMVTTANAANIKWFWSAPLIGNSSQHEVIQYTVDLSDHSWMDDVKEVNSTISKITTNGKFSNLDQLEFLVNKELERQNIGRNFRIRDVTRVDVLDPKDIWK